MSRDYVYSAAAYAAHAHGTQTRKYSGLPYIVHPMEVSILVAYARPGDVELEAAAWLHDVLEDTPITEYKLRQNFSPRTCDAVVYMTAVEVKGNRSIRKQAEAHRLAAGPEEFHVIKLGDVYSNIQDISLNDPKFAEVYLPEQEYLLSQLSRRSNAGDEKSLWDLAWNAVQDEFNNLALMKGETND